MQTPDASAEVTAALQIYFLPSQCISSLACRRCSPSTCWVKCSACFAQSSSLCTELIACQQDLLRRPPGQPRLRLPAGLKHRIFARNIEALTSLRELKASCLLLWRAKLLDGAAQHAHDMQELRMTAAAAFEGDTRVHIFHGFPITVCKLPTLTSLQLSSAGEHTAGFPVLLHFPRWCVVDRWLQQPAWV